MPEFDPEAYLRQGAPAAQPPPAQTPASERPIDLVGPTARGARGFARGLAGLASMFPDPMEPIYSDEIRQQREQGREKLRSWATAPVATTSESVGRVAGEVAPFLFQPEVGLGRAAAAYGGRVVPWLGRLAERAIQGGTAGGLQPTEGSQVTGAEAGAATAVLGPAAGKLAATVAGKVAGHGARHALIVPIAALAAEAAKQVGMPAHYMFWPVYVSLLGASHKSGLGIEAIAQRAFRSLPQAAQDAARRTAGTIGTATRKASGAVAGEAVSGKQGFDPEIFLQQRGEKRSEGETPFQVAGDVVPFPKEVGSGSVARQLEANPMRSMAGQHTIDTTPHLDLLNILGFPGGEQINPFYRPRG